MDPVYGPCIYGLLPSVFLVLAAAYRPPQTIGLVAVLDYPIEARQGGIIQHNAELCKMIPFPVLD